MNRASVVVAGLAAVIGSAAAQTGRDYISIVGSSTVYPFATVVAEQFGRTSDFRTPKIESTGSGGGIKLFCAGVGPAHPDVTNSSRRIKQSEIEMCKGHGVEEIIEVKIGYDGIVLAHSQAAEPIELSRREIFLALARLVPAPDGSETLVDNPYRQWRQIRADLPAARIEVLGPPPTSGTRDAFVELAMEGGCKSFDWIAAMEQQDGDRFKTVCHSLREDGHFVEAGENDNLIVQKLQANPASFGIFGFSFLDQNFDVVQGVVIDGEEPTFEAIADGAYPISRPLYFYVKKAHIGAIPGLEAFLAEFTSDRAWGEDGYLSERGLIPMPEVERAEVARAVREQSTLERVAQH